MRAIKAALLLATLLIHQTNGIRWLALSKFSSSATTAVGQPPERMCESMKGSLIKKQITFCKRNPSFMDSVRMGAVQAIDECQFQFRSRRWNCSTLSADINRNLEMMRKQLGDLTGGQGGGPRAPGLPRGPSGFQAMMNNLQDSHQDRPQAGSFMAAAASSANRKNKIDQERGNRRRKSKSSPLMGMNQFLNDQPALVPSQESSYTREQNTYRSLRRNARGGRSNNVNGGNSRNSRNVRRGRRLSRKARHGQNGSPRRNDEEITNDTDKGKEEEDGFLMDDPDDEEDEDFDEEEDEDDFKDDNIQDAWLSSTQQATNLTAGIYGPPSGTTFGAGSSSLKGPLAPGIPFGNPRGSRQPQAFGGFSYPSPSDLASLTKDLKMSNGDMRKSGRKGGNNGKRNGKGGGKGKKKDDLESWQTALGGFYPVVSSGTREMAFVHAISSAGVAHALTRACSSGELENCGCDRSLRGMSPEGFQWSGCSDNVDFGITFSRTFVDARDRRKSRKRPKKAQPLMNLHNNEAGRKLLERNMKVECKCHGVSGSCELKTCWRSVAPFRMIGEILKNKFDSAHEVQQKKKRGRRMLMPKFERFKPHTDTDLVYLKTSPDYCEFDVKKGSLGTHGRECDHRSPGIDGCELMCCMRGYTTRKVSRVERCKCKFHWCCFVKCEECYREVEVSTCN